jgi:hypothetical protein
LDDIWSYFEESARTALAKGKEAALRFECCQKAYDRVNDAPASCAGQHVFAADRALRELNPNILHSCGHSSQGAAKKASVAITGQGGAYELHEAASSLSAAKSVHEKILAEAGWKLEKTFSMILDAAWTQQLKAHGPIIPMLPSLLGLLYHQECGAVHLAARIQQAFTYQSSDEGPLGIENGRPEELEIAAKEIYVKWDRLITNKNHNSQAKACTWVAAFEHHDFIDTRAMELMQNEIGALLQEDCADTRDEARADRMAADCVAAQLSPPLLHHLRIIILKCTKQAWGRCSWSPISWRKGGEY